ncbi:MAG: DUF2459 domain-containing protein [Candidatus Competibacteraceae bacterium]
MLKPLLLLAVIFCYACVSTITPAPLVSGTPPYTHFYVVSHGWHTGVVLRRVDIPAPLWPESRDFPNAEYLEVGWGEWDFYQAPDAGSSLGLQAVLWPNASVLQVVGFSEPLTKTYPESEIVELALSLAGLEDLIRYIDHSYAREGGSRATALGQSLYGEGRFYPAQGKFYLFNTCNVWTAGALQAAGYPLSPTLALTAESVMAPVRRFGTVVQSRSAER